MSSSSHPVEDLAFAYLERMESEGPAALDALCQEHPQHASALRRLVAQIRRLGLTTAPPAAESLRQRLGEYRVLSRLGGGGMGVVYLAEHERLRRQVALKLLRPGVLSQPRSRARFRREIEALSRLDHPHICTVYDAGEVDGAPFLAMRHVTGTTLAQRIEQAREARATGRSSASSSEGAAPVAVLLVLLEKVARALHVAHEASVIHRDVKPANIMVDERGEPAVLDFGLARDELGGDSQLTVSTDQVGTPGFMAPEQIEPGRGAVDRRTDVYQLGVTAYQCLTLSLPFDVPTREGLYRAILAGDLTDPRLLRRRAGRDVGAVVLRAMAREPKQRFATALEFAEELERIRLHRPILTRQPGPVLRTVRWCQRNRVAAVFLATLTVGFAVALVLLSINSRARRELAARDLMSSALAVAERSPELAFKLVREAELREPGRREYVETLQQILGMLHETDRVEAGSPAGRPQWSPDSRVLGIASDRAGNFLMRGRGSSVTIPPPDEKRFADAFAFSPDSSHVAISSGPGRVLRFDLKGRPNGPPLLTGAEVGGVLCLRYCADGTLLAGTGKGAIVRWDEDGSDHVVVQPAGVAIQSIELSPDGRFAVAVANIESESSGTVHVLDLVTGRALPLDLPGRGIFVGLGHDRLVVACDLNQLRILGYDGSELARNHLPAGECPFVVAVDPSCTCFALGCLSGAIRLYDWNGLLLREWHGDPSIIDLDFDADGQRLLTVGFFSQRAQVWDLRGNLLADLLGHRNGVNGALFSPDGREVASGSTDGTVRRWQLRPRGARVVYLGDLGRAESWFTVKPSPDGERYVATLWFGMVCVLDHHFHLLHRFDAEGYLVHYTNDGRRAGLSAADGGVRVLDLERGTIDTLARFPTAQIPTFVLPLSDGRVVTHGEAGLLVIDPRDGSQEPLVTEPPTPDEAEYVVWLDLSPDESRLLLSRAAEVAVYRFADGVLRHVRSLPHPGWMVMGSCFSRDGSRVLTGCEDGIARLWDLTSDAPPHEFVGHQGHIRCVSLSPDERLAVTASSDKTAIVWDLASGEPVMVLRGHRGTVFSADFTPDGHQVVTASQDGTVRWWWVHADDVKKAAEALQIPEFTDEERRLIERLRRPR